MKNISDSEMKKLDALVGFVNDIAEVVADPDEALDFNAKDCPVYAIGYSDGKDSKIKMSTLESSRIKDFTDNLNEILELVKSSVKTDYTERWEILRG